MRDDSVSYSFLTSPCFPGKAHKLTHSCDYKMHTSPSTVRVTQQQDATQRRDESIIVSHYAGENCMAPSLIAAFLLLKINRQMNKLEL